MFQQRITSSFPFPTRDERYEVLRRCTVADPAHWWGHHGSPEPTAGPCLTHVRRGSSWSWGRGAGPPPLLLWMRLHCGDITVGTWPWGHHRGDITVGISPWGYCRVSTLADRLSSCCTSRPVSEPLPQRALLLSFLCLTPSRRRGCGGLAGAGRTEGWKMTDRMRILHPPGLRRWEYQLLP